MKVQVESVSPIEKKLAIEVEADRVAAEFDRAYRGLSRQVRIPGFRPGKAPRRILESRYRDQVEQDVARVLIETSYREAVEKEELFPVSNPVVSSDKLEPGQVFRFEARIEIKPAIETVSFKGLEYERSEPKVEDSMVDDELERIRQSLATFAPIEDRQKAEIGDYAVIDYVGSQDGEEIEGAKGEGTTVKVEEGTLLEGNAPMLEGIAVGETLETEVEFPPDYPVESLRGTTGTFSIVLNSLKRREIPELDDELAKDLGGDAQTLEELKAEIRQRITRSEKQRVERENRDKILKALIAANELEVPKAMVERGIDSMIMGAAERFQRQGMDIRSMGLDLRKIREDLREEAASRVKSILLLEALAKQEGLEVGDEDTDAEIARMAAELEMPEPKVRAHFSADPSEQDALRERLLEEKTVALIEREAKVSG